MRVPRLEYERWVYEQLAAHDFNVHVPWSIWSDDAAVAELRSAAIANGRCATPAKDGSNDICVMENGHDGKHAPELMLEARALVVAEGMGIDLVHATGPGSG